MRWRGGRESSNIEDRRGIGGGGLAVGGGIGTLVIALLAFLFGADPRQLLEQAPPPDQPPAAASRPGEATDEGRQFVSVVLGYTEDVWNDIFRRSGRQYQEPKLVLFNNRVDSACGMATSAVGPFYCPADSKVYIDLAFFRELETQFRASGDFAQAYVIAHEIGHHVQNLLGTSDKVHSLQQRAGETQANRLSVMLELQADCYAGVWGHFQGRKGVLEQGDPEEALRAATAIGDDRLQMRGQGHVVPDSFTHGTSEQRVRWFRVGFESGDVKRCDTFSARSL
jgi:hypothetical protein